MSAEANQPFRELESTGGKYFSLSDEPPVFAGGKGAELIAVDGRRYIDFACGSGTNALGHNHPAIAEALAGQLRTGITHIGPHFHTEVQGRFYRQLTEVLPQHLHCFHPATNGTEATEVALKAAMHATGRRQFLALEGGYHGRTFGALSVSEAKGKNKKLEPFAPSAAFLPFAEHDDQVKAALGKAEALLKGGNVAALIVEPVQATAGMRLPAKGYLEALAELARKNGCLVIVDEVFCSFGRSGCGFGFQHFDIEPDLVILAKSLGGSLPAGLVAGRKGILCGWKAGTQSSTFQLHPLSAAAGSAFIEVLIRDGLVKHAGEIGDWFEGARGRIEALPNVRSYRGLGAMWGVVMENESICHGVRRRALDLGLITWECGVDGEVIGLVPPLTIEREFFDLALDRFCQALKG